MKPLSSACSPPVERSRSSSEIDLASQLHDLFGWNREVGRRALRVAGKERENPLANRAKFALFGSEERLSSDEVGGVPEIERETETALGVREDGRDVGVLHESVPRSNPQKAL